MYTEAKDVAYAAKQPVVAGPVIKVYPDDSDDEEWKMEKKLRKEQRKREK